VLSAPSVRFALIGALALGVLVSCGGAEGAEKAAPATTSTRPTTTTSTSTTTSTTLPPTTTTTAPPLPSQLASIVAGAQPRAAIDPAGLAEQLAQSEAAIRDPGAAPELVDAAGRLAQLAYRRLADHPEWDAAVLAAVDPSLHGTITSVVSSRREFRAMHHTLSDTLPAWRIVEPLPADQLLALYQEAEATFGVPWYVLASVNLIETGMGRIQGLSVAGAQGPMQFMPGTWAAYGMGGNVNDPRDAILGAANYLRANGAADGTSEGLDHALYRYNNSERYVRGVRAIAEVMRAEPMTLRGFHAWEVVYLSTAGDIVLEPGYETPERIPVAAFLAAHPDAATG
jgi:membrane-bound lytic murein transglycosylase B